jgi:excisionase family DNA binding protein
MTPKVYTTREAAKLIGISHQTLYTWIVEKHIEAPKPIVTGKSTMRLWSKAQIEAAKKFKGTLKRGQTTKKRQ